MIAAAGLVLVLALVGPADLGLGDLPAYREALEARPGGPAPPRVTFRDLWDDPEGFRGRPVAFRGRVVRVYRSAPVGQLPALCEFWMRDEVGNLVCGVAPDGPATDRVVREPSELIASGTSLGLIPYPSGDVIRRAR